MAKYKVPSVGSIITVTTRYRDYYYYSTNEWADTTYENVQVLAPEPWFKPNQFKISSDDPRKSFRVINIDSVIDLVGGDESEVDTTTRTVPIAGKNGNEYYVTIHEGTPVKCTCPGFHYRQTCRHLKEAVDLISNTLEDKGCEMGNNDSSKSKTTRRMKMTAKTFTWGQRLALINTYKPNDGVACTALGVSQDELDTARGLMEAGTISLDESVVTSNADIFKGVKASAATTRVEKPAVTKTTGKATGSKESKTTTTTTVKKPAASATAPSAQPKKRGRKGSKIQNAFAAIPSEPTDANAFAARHNVSLAVLRQSKRFDKTGTGVVRVRKDKDTNALMVWREDEASA